MANSKKVAFFLNIYIMYIRIITTVNCFCARNSAWTLCLAKKKLISHYNYLVLEMLVCKIMVSPYIQRKVEGWCKISPRTDSISKNHRSEKKKVQPTNLRDERKIKGNVPFFTEVRFDRWQSPDMNWLDNSKLERWQLGWKLSAVWRKSKLHAGN